MLNVDMHWDGETKNFRKRTALIINLLCVCFHNFFPLNFELEILYTSSKLPFLQYSVSNFRFLFPFQNFHRSLPKMAKWAQFCKRACFYVTLFQKRILKKSRASFFGSLQTLLDEVSKRTSLTMPLEFRVFFADFYPSVP